MPDIGVCAVVKPEVSSETMQKRISLMKAAGIDFVRTTFAWSLIEKTPGAYDFERVDLAVELAEKNGITLLAMLTHTPKWATPIADHLDAWLAYVEATVKRYPQVRYWEVFNEPDLEHYWGGPRDPATYARLLRLTYAKIKSIDPSLLVVSGAASSANDASGGYNPYAERVFAAGVAGAFDAYGIHPYRWPHAPEESVYAANIRRPNKLTLEGVIEKYLALMAAHGSGDRPLWITEAGVTTYPGTLGPDGKRTTKRLNLGATEEEQAQFLPRSILLAFQYGASTWMWFTAQTAERDPEDIEDWFGIIRPDFTPRPAYYALKALRHAYPVGSSLLKDRYLKAPVYRLAWKRPDGQVAWALWIAARGAQTPCELRLSGKISESFDALGQSIPLTVTDGRTRAVLSGRVLYIIGPETIDLRP